MRERMSDAEAMMWVVEKDPSLRSDFMNITLLDQAPDMDRLQVKVRAGIEALPRLRQRVVTPPLRLAPPEWGDDPDFDVNYHLRRLAVPGPGTVRDLLDLAATLAVQPLDRARPLWEMTVVEGLEGGRAALLQKVHHTVIDGVGGVKFSMMMLDLERDPTPAPRALLADVPSELAAAEQADRDADPVRRSSPLNVIADALTFNTRRGLGALRQTVSSALDLAAHPDRLPALAAEAARLAGSVRRQAFISGRSLSTVLTGRSLGRRFELFSIPLSRARAVAKALDGTINDVYVTGVTGALGMYHDRMGAPCEVLRMAMPVNLRGDDDLEMGGNNFAPSRLLVPIAPKDPEERFALVRDRLREVRDEPALALTSSLAAVLGMLPTALLVNATRSQVRTIDFATSNLRGAPIDLYLGGALIQSNHPMGPCTGAALNITMLSYRDSLDMGLNLDTAAITDPATLLDCMAESFESLLSVAG